MRILSRNKQDIWYCNPAGSEYVVDRNGLKTGERHIIYGTPTKARMSMSISSGANNLGSQGMANLEAYGIETGYTHRAVTEDMSCGMGEESIVWFGKTPGANWDDVPHNFKVVRKATSLNHLIFYLKESDVT